MDNWEDTDSAIAAIATIEAYLLLVPAIYEIAKVLVPGLPPASTLLTMWNSSAIQAFLVPWDQVHILSGTSLWFAVLSAGWINKIKHNTPHETGKNSKTLKEQLEMDDELEKRGAGRQGEGTGRDTYLKMALLC